MSGSAELPGGSRPHLIRLQKWVRIRSIVLNRLGKAGFPEATMLQILKLTVSGLPQEWLSLEEAVLYYATGQVLWEAGSEIATLHGGHNARSGLRSEVRVNSIIGVNGMGRVNPFDIVPSLSNSKLFQRDR